MILVGAGATPLIALLVLLFSGGSFESRAKSAAGWLAIGAVLTGVGWVRRRLQ
jgi:hypothetical protein